MSAENRPAKNREQLSRIGAESKAMTAAAQASCQDTEAHIRSSRNLIARSLELLGRRFSQLSDD